MYHKEFFRPLLGFTGMVHQRNLNIRRRLEVTDVVAAVQGYQQNYTNQS